MEAVNGRLIIKEDELEQACERLEQIIKTKITLLSLPKKVSYNVYYGDEKDHNMLWIDLFTKEDELPFGYIGYMTENATPQLVYKDGRFEFYYIFEVGQNTCTNVRTLNNMAYHDMEKGDKFLEDLIIDEINLKASRLTLLNNLLGE